MSVVQRRPRPETYDRRRCNLAGAFIIAINTLLASAGPREAPAGLVGRCPASGQVTARDGVRRRRGGRSP